jgi:hypothetical protein
MNTKYTSTISGEKRTNTVLFLPLPQPQPIDISQKRARHVEVVVEEPVRKSYMRRSHDQGEFASLMAIAFSATSAVPLNSGSYSSAASASLVS